MKQTRTSKVILYHFENVLQLIKKKCVQPIDDQPLKQVNDFVSERLFRHYYKIAFSIKLSEKGN